MKVWITKYALTIGIYEVEADRRMDEDMISVKENGEEKYYYGYEWTRTKEEAVEIAYELRNYEILSLKKQIEKLEKMKFE